MNVHDTQLACLLRRQDLLPQSAWSQHTDFIPSSPRKQVWEVKHWARAPREKQVTAEKEQAVVSWKFKLNVHFLFVIESVPHVSNLVSRASRGQTSSAGRVEMFGVCLGQTRYPSSISGNNPAVLYHLLSTSSHSLRALLPAMLLTVSLLPRYMAALSEPFANLLIL